MLTNNEIRERVQVATLEILAATLVLTNATLQLQMRHFDDAIVGLKEIKGMIDSVIQTIPKDEDL